MTNRLTITLLFVVIFVKITLIIILDRTPEVFENYAIAKNYLETGKMFYVLDGNIDYCHQFPLFGWILIAFQAAFGELLLPILIFQVLMGTFLALVLLGVKRLIIPRENSKVLEIGLLLMVSFHPILLHYQMNVIHPVTLDAVLFSTLLVYSLRYATKSIRSGGDRLLLVVITGLCLLERFTLITALIPFLWLELRNKRELLRTAMLLLSSVLIFLIPWMSRNYIHTGKFQMTSGVYRYLWVGIQAETDGTNTLIGGESYYQLFPDEVATQWSNWSLDEQLSFYERNYKSTLKNNPPWILKMWGKKLGNYFWFSRSFGNQNGYDPLLLLFLKIIRVILLTSIPIALYLGGSKVKLLCLAILGLGILQSFFYIESRHFVPAIGVSLVIFSVALFEIKKRLSLGHAKKLD